MRDDGAIGSPSYHDSDVPYVRGIATGDLQNDFRDPVRIMLDFVAVLDLSVPGEGEVT